MMEHTFDTSEKAKDRRLNFLVWASFGTFLAILVFALIAGPKILDNASTTNQLKQSNQIQGCRSQFRIEVDDASAVLQASRARLDRNTSEGFAALVVNRDLPAAQSALALSASIRADVKAAEAGLLTATDKYREQVKLSRHNPTKFLLLCAAADDE